MKTAIFLLTLMIVGCGVKGGKVKSAAADPNLVDPPYDPITNSWIGSYTKHYQEVLFPSTLETCNVDVNGNPTCGFYGVTGCNSFPDFSITATTISFGGLLIKQTVPFGSNGVTIVYGLNQTIIIVDQPPGQVIASITGWGNGACLVVFDVTQ